MNFITFHPGAQCRIISRKFSIRHWMQDQQTSKIPSRIWVRFSPFSLTEFRNLLLCCHFYDEAYTHTTPRICCPVVHQSLPHFRKWFKSCSLKLQRYSTVWFIEFNLIFSLDRWFSFFYTEISLREVAYVILVLYYRFKKMYERQRKRNLYGIEIECFGNIYSVI